MGCRERQRRRAEARGRALRDPPLLGCKRQLLRDPRRCDGLIGSSACCFARDVTRLGASGASSTSRWRAAHDARSARPTSTARALLFHLKTHLMLMCFRFLLSPASDKTAAHSRRSYLTQVAAPCLPAFTTAHLALALYLCHPAGHRRATMAPPHTCDLFEHGSHRFPATSLEHADWHRTERQRAHSLWKVAVSATKGLFSGPTPNDSRADGVVAQPHWNRY